MSTHIVPPMKRCSKCGEEKPLTSECWYRNRSTKDKFTHWCKSCSKKSNTNWKQHNNEKIRSDAQEYYRLNKEIYRERSRQWRSENKQRALENEREWRRKNSEKVAATQRSYRVTHRHEMNERCRLWRANNPQKHHEAVRRWREANRERYLATLSSYRTSSHGREMRRRQQRASFAKNPELARERARKRYQDNPIIRRACSAKRRALLRGASGAFTTQDILLAKRAQRNKCWHCGIDVSKKYDIDHLIPISRGGNNDPRNIVISCPSCNRSKNNKMTWEWNGRLF